MKILHFITRMDGGGSAVNTLVCAMRQVQEDHRVCLAFGPSEESRMSKTEETRMKENLDAFRHAGGEVCIIPSLLRKPSIHDVRAFFQMKRLVSRGFDVVHTHTSKAGILGRLAAWKRTGAVVHTSHGHIFHGYFGKVKTSVFISLERRMANRAHALVALTRAERDDHLRLHIGRPEQWRVIPSGVDVAGIQKNVAAWLEGHSDVRTWDAVSVGRLAPVKGMERLIRAWVRVCEMKPEARLVIVGDGEERTGLGQLCHTLDIGNNVHFAGWCDPVPYLAASRCFALLSHNEGMGRVVVEAMASGLPCVVSNVCGLKELVTKNCGTVVDADDVNVVADALLQDWPVSARLACQERARAYSVEVMVQALQRLYDGLLKGA